MRTCLFRTWPFASCGTTRQVRCEDPSAGRLRQLTAHTVLAFKHATRKRRNPRPVGQCGIERGRYASTRILAGIASGSSLVVHLHRRARERGHPSVGDKPDEVGLLQTLRHIGDWDRRRPSRFEREPTSRVKLEEPEQDFADDAAAHGAEVLALCDELRLLEDVEPDRGRLRGLEFYPREDAIDLEGFGDDSGRRRGEEDPLPPTICRSPASGRAMPARVAAPLALGPLPPRLQCSRCSARTRRAG